MVDVRQEGKKSKRVSSWVEGEFLAVGVESVHVLTLRGHEAIALSRVDRARLAVHQSQTNQGSLLTLGGVLSTASNGLAAIFTAPLWLIVGPLTTGAVSRDPLRDVPSKSWKDVSIYARFPQGLPTGFDDAGIQFDPRLRPWAGGAGMISLPPPGAGTTSSFYLVRLVSGETWKVRKIRYSSKEVVHFVGVEGRQRQLRARDVIWIRDERDIEVTELLLSPP